METNEKRVIVHQDMPDAETVSKWLHICSRDDAGEHCYKCPYNTDPNEDGCGKLLSDAEKLIRFLMG